MKFVIVIEAVEGRGAIFDGDVIELVARDAANADNEVAASGYTWSASAGRLFGPDGSTYDVFGPRVMLDTAGAGGENILITMRPPHGSAGDDVKAAPSGQKRKRQSSQSGGGDSGNDHGSDEDGTQPAGEDDGTITRKIYVARGKSGTTVPTITRLTRTAGVETSDKWLWPFIRNQTAAIGFRAYEDFLDRLAAEVEAKGGPGLDKAVSLTLNTSLPPDKVTCILARGTQAYNLLHLATQIFLMCRCGVAADGEERHHLFPTGYDTRGERLKLESESNRLQQQHVTLADLEDKLREYLGETQRLPYIDDILKAMLGPRKDDPKTIATYYGLLHARARCPALIELLWSYWHEEGMLAQSINAVAIRFQNKRRGARDPLARLEIDPLRPLNNLLWGYIQNEYSRLSVVRRAYEYDHHYGLTLQGKAVPPLESADSRSKFLEAFHGLLETASTFYRADADTTVVADAFPVLNALKDLHLILAEGAHNQYADLPSTARTEMLIEQWLLARPEMRSFLGGRAMVPYPEGWMGQVDTMRRIQNWGQTGVTHFRDLGVFGEQILLSVRFGNWSLLDEEHAKNWARYWKSEIQGYVHAYRAVTGVDLAAEPAGEEDLQRRRAMPAALIARRIAVTPRALPAAE